MTATAARQTVTNSTPTIDLSKLIFNTFNLPMNTHIVVVGTGGTGGYVIRDVCRLIENKISKNQSVKLTLIDPDVVEAKNLIRQNFIKGDLGKYKADVLAERYAAAFGIEIGVITEKCTRNILLELALETDSVNRLIHPLIVIGCIDNNAARREIHEFFKVYGMSNGRALAWIDSGNESSSGQVVLGATGEASTYYLPFITQIYPEILDPKRDPKTEVSCAERAERDVQNMFINMTAANQILNFLNTMYSSKRSSIHGVEFSINGLADAIYIKDKLTKSSRSGTIWR